MGLFQFDDSHSIASYNSYAIACFISSCSAALNLLGLASSYALKILLKIYKSFQNGSALHACA